MVISRRGGKHDVLRKSNDDFAERNIACNGNLSFLSFDIAASQLIAVAPIDSTY
jgi:hypothetical protein